MSRSLRRSSILAVVAVVALVLGWTLLRPHPVPVSVVEVARGRVESSVVNSRAGTVRSRLRAEMSPGISGLVAEIPARKGRSVRRGDVLLRIDDAEYAANASLAERSLEATRSSAREACLRAELASRERQRAESLHDRGLFSDQQLDDVRTRAQVTEAECAAAAARSQQAEAALRAARATLDKTVVRAPFSGVVLDVSTEVGEWISPSPPGVFIPPVIDLIDPDSLYVSAPMDEADVAEIRVGQSARMMLDAYRDREFSGRVSYVASYVQTQQEQNRTLTVEAVFGPQDLPANLLPGLSADIEVILDAHDDVLRIPTFALLEGDRVLVVESGRLVSREVQVGLRNWQWVEILAGLQAGDKVATSLDRPEVVEGARARIEYAAPR